MTVEKKDSHEFFFSMMFHSRKNNTKINNVHEKCLGLIYSDKRSSLEKNGSVSTHHRNTHVLATEMYKVKND